MDLLQIMGSAKLKVDQMVWKNLPVTVMKVTTLFQSRHCFRLDIDENLSQREKRLDK